MAAVWSDDALRQELDDLLAMTDQMHAQLLAHDWEGLAENQSLRDRRLRQLFERQIPPEAAGLVESGIQAILKTDEDMKGILMRVRDEIGRELRGNQESREVARTYSRNSREGR
ncbi:MAG: flagellar protein FliT [Halothiobacillaceae bacterium]